MAPAPTHEGKPLFGTRVSAHRGAALALWRGLCCSVGPGKAPLCFAPGRRVWALIV